MTVDVYETVRSRRGPAVMDCKEIPCPGGPVDTQAVSQAAEVLRQGGVVAFPTETSYGLGAGADHPQALKHIYEIKKRPADKPLLVLIDHIGDLSSIVDSVPDMAKRLMDRFWPGPLTILFPVARGLAYPLHCGTGKIGVRISSNPWATALVHAAGRPITATSANVSGSSAAVSAEEVRRQLVSPAPDFVLDGGRLASGACSTIVDVTDTTPVHQQGAMTTVPVKIIRQGVISSDEILRTVTMHH